MLATARFVITKIVSIKKVLFFLIFLGGAHVLRLFSDSEESAS